MRKQLCGMLAGIFFVFALSACTNSAPSPETIPSKTQAAPNSFSQVASITRQARDAANAATENDISAAYEYIKSNYTDCFKDNATMEQMMYYGWLLEYTYEGDTSTAGQIPPTATAPKPAWNRYNIQSLPCSRAQRNKPHSNRHPPIPQKKTAERFMSPKQAKNITTPILAAKAPIIPAVWQSLAENVCSVK